MNKNRKSSPGLLLASAAIIIGAFAIRYYDDRYGEEAVRASQNFGECEYSSKNVTLEDFANGVYRVRKRR